MVDNKTLKENARNQLGNQLFKEKWLMMLVACAIPSLIISAINSILGSNPMNYIVILQDDPLEFYKMVMASSTLSSIATLVVGGPLLYGLVKVVLAQVEGEKWTFANLFDGFKECFVKSFLLYLLQSIFLALWMFLLIVPGIIKIYSYSMSFYIQRDNNKKEAVDCITESRQLMDGHKWQLFCLDLSFIGWYILGALCFGVGTLFVVPYHEMARANFYEALVAEKATVNTDDETETAETTETKTEEPFEGEVFEELSVEETEKSEETSEEKVEEITPTEEN